MKTENGLPSKILPYARRTTIGLGAMVIIVLLIVTVSNLFDAELTPEAKSILSAGPETNLNATHNEAYTTLLGLFSDESENPGAVGEEYIEKLKSNDAWEVKTKGPSRKASQHELPPNCRQNRDFCASAGPEEVTFLSSNRHIVNRMNQLPSFGRVVSSKVNSGLPITLRLLSTNSFNLLSGSRIQRAAWSIELALASKTDATLSQKLFEVFIDWQASNRFLISSLESEIALIDAMVLLTAIESNRDFIKSVVKTHPGLLRQVETLLKTDSTSLEMKELDPNKILNRAYQIELQILQATFNELENSDAAKRQFSFGLATISSTETLGSEAASLVDRLLLEIGFLPNATVNLIAQAMVHSDEKVENEYKSLRFIHPRNFVGKYLATMFASQYVAGKKNLVNRVSRLKEPVTFEAGS